MNPFIQPDWPAPPQVKAFTSLRSGGNMAFADSRQTLRKFLKLPAEPLWINQVHGNTVLEALPANRDKEADASFARAAKQVCAIMTADCLPLLLCDAEGRQVAAIHAGWRGLANGIIGETLKALSGPPASLLAWFGPAIGPEKFEVGQEVYDRFCTLAQSNQHAFTRATPTTWLADIYELARLQLRARGVSRIFGGNYCTHTENDKFFSYRRDQGKTGRMVSLIWLDSDPADLSCHMDLNSP